MNNAVQNYIDIDKIGINQEIPCSRDFIVESPSSMNKDFPCSMNEFSVTE